MRHVTPLCISSLIVRVTLDMAGIILTAAGLGFGLGAQPLPEWGAMIASGCRFILDQWWVAAMPGIAILVVSLGFNLLGDGLRDALTRRRAANEHAPHRQEPKVSYPTRTGVIEAVRGVSFTLAKGTPRHRRGTGSGKSQTAAIMGLTSPHGIIVTADTLDFNGIDLPSASAKQRRQLRGKRIAMVLQDPKYSLDPVMTIGRQICETLRTHEKIEKGEARDRAIAMLEAAQIRESKRCPIFIRMKYRAHGSARYDRHDADRRSRTVTIADELTSARRDGAA